MDPSSLKYLPILLAILTAHTYGNDLWCMDNDVTSYSGTARSFDFLAVTGQASVKLVDASDTQEDFNAGDELNLYCCFESQQTVIIEWFKDDKPINAGQTYQFSENNQVLTIPKAKASDSGAYRCKGFNKLGNQSQNIKVRVHVPPCSNTPQIRSLQSNVIAKKNETVTLTCTVTSSCNMKFPRFYWKDAQANLHFIQNYSTIHKANGNNKIRIKLTIKNVNKTHEGNYTCTVTDLNGVTSSSILLKIL